MAPYLIQRSKIYEVEQRVNTLLIDENLAVTAEEAMSQAKPRRKLDDGSLGEKYGEVVRVVSVGGGARELCGGDSRTVLSGAGVVKLLSESRWSWSPAAGG
jgi:alanyl-tRNA synthetase